MSPVKVVTCAGCGREGPHRAKGLCARCYAKRRQRKVVCMDCGRFSLEYRGGRCARCYRLAHMTVKTCDICREERLTWGPTCRRCRLRARSSSGACRECGRWVARLWGRRCTRCAKTHWVTSTCASCLGWSMSIESGRCRGCRDFEHHNLLDGLRRSCGRSIRVNRFGRCRLCTVTRWSLRSAGDPAWGEEPGERGGIQLFFTDVVGRPQRSRRSTGSSGFLRVAGTSAAVQQRFFVALNPQLAPDLAPSGSLPSDLVTAIRAFGDARGWKAPTTAGVTKAVLLLADEGTWSLSETVVNELRRLHLPVGRVREFLVDHGASVPDPQTDAWIDQHLETLVPTIRAEVMAWVEALVGQGPGGRARRRGTVRHYVAAVAPVITEWSIVKGSLREITAEDVGAAAATLEGWHRVMIAVALRSLFKTLKSRRLIFSDPTRTLSPGRFPSTPVLGLDLSSRSLLLSSLERVDHRLVVLLAGVHALSRADIMGLRLDDIDLDASAIEVRSRNRPLDRLVADHVVAWLEVRRQRWPRSANPYLLVTEKSAYGVGRVSSGYFTAVFAGLPTTAAGLRADRLFAEAIESGGDALRLVRLFGLSPAGAMRYCAPALIDGAGEGAHHGSPDGSAELSTIGATTGEIAQSSQPITLQ